MPRHSISPLLVLTGVIVLGLFVVGGVAAQSPASQRFTHAGLGLSITPPAGWNRLKDVPADGAGTRATPQERHALMQRLAGNAEGQFVFNEPLGTLEVTEPARVVVRVMSADTVAGRPVDDLVAGLNAQQNPMLTGPVTVTQVSGRPAAHAVMRQPIPWRDSTVIVLSRAWFVPRGGFMLMIEMAAPEHRSAALDATFREVLQSVQIDD